MKFNEWLMEQNTREDVIGRLATYLQRDATSPLWSSDLVVFNRYLSARRFDAEMIESFALAVAEWKMLASN